MEGKAENVKQNNKYDYNKENYNKEYITNTIKNNKSGFTKGFMAYHPIVNFIYFLFVIGFSMFLMHPVCLIVSFVSGFIYSAILKGEGTVKNNLLMTVPLMIAMAFINPAFNHKGVTILTYLPGGNPLTLESMAYGVAAAVMIAAVICWFSCYNSIMTSDKFVYLFGRIIPALSLVFSMALRFVPKFAAQIKEVANAQKCIGRDISQKDCGLIKRLKYGLNIISIMITRSLEDGIETSDSMRARGYGLPGRTAFSVFKFEKRDLYSLLLILTCGIITITSSVTQNMGYSYFPYMRASKTGAFSVISYVAYFVLCVYPMICDIKEEVKWKALKSKI